MRMKTCLTALLMLCLLCSPISTAIMENADAQTVEKQTEAVAVSEEAAAVETAADESTAGDVTDSVIMFYREHQDICERAYEYYRGYEANLNQYVVPPKAITKEDFLTTARPVTILVMTANPIERGILLRWLSEKTGEALPTYRIGESTFNLALIDGERAIVHINPGKTGEEYTRRAINRFCDVMNPDYICLAGICYGVNSEKYSIGSVFISDSIKTFRLNFRDSIDSDDIRFEVEEEYEAQPSRVIIQRVEDTLMYTQIHNFLSTPDHDVIADATVGRFLSCNSLMSSSRVKQAIVDQYTVKGSQPLGGEMEGAGVLKSNIVEETNFDGWMIIKSVCDWGEKKNALDPDPQVSEHMKDCLQAFAMSNTCSVFDVILDVLR